MHDTNAWPDSLYAASSSSEDKAGANGADGANSGVSKGSGSVGRNGDPTQDVTQWVADHWDATYSLLYRLTASRHEAEDLTQETFLRGIQRQGSFKAGTNLRAWLLRIATNAFVDHRRRRKVMKIVPLSEELREPGPTKERGVGQGLEGREVYASIESAIAGLPETPRVVFLLRSQQELSFREIAETLGTTEETARWHMMQARRQLLVKLDGIL